MKFVHGGPEHESMVLSTDTRCAKLWRKQTGEPITAMEMENDVHSMEVVPNTGLCMFPVDAPKVQVFFIPHLGPAPKWCSFLDCLTEELEEEKANDNPTTYDNYRFITLQELEELGIEMLIGSKMLRAYMHGWFIDDRLYKKVKEERSGEKTIKDRRIELINEEIEKQRGGKSRIEVTKTKANKHLQDAVEDDRFGSLFDNKEFEIDEDDDDWKIRNPMKNAKKVKKLLNWPVFFLQFLKH